MGAELEAEAASRAGGETFLGVERSLTGKRWRAKAADDRAALTLAQRLGLPEVIARVLAARGVGPEDADLFLNPTLKALLPDPGGLRDMDAACERLASALLQGETIAVFADYDVDGATSAALVLRYAALLGAEVRLYVPDRLREGYGPGEAALLRLRDEGVSLVLTLDCGTTAYEPLEAAAAAGLDVIVVDHHEAEGRLPRAVAVVNPNRMDESGALGHLAAVGVTFLLLVGLNRTLREAGRFADRPEPDLRKLLDLVALGTVCDVVPLTGINRALVAQGLKVMAGRSNVGLTALADRAGLSEPPGAYHAGFVLGPRINAGGRIGEASLGARLLSTNDGAEAQALAERLDGLNRERRQIETKVLAAALAEAEADAGAAAVFAAGEGWHPGVIGIVAGRLKERFHRPAFVVSLAGDVGTGSARSVSGLDLGAAVLAAVQAGHLIRGGGHAMAAGFTVARDRLGALKRFLCERSAAALARADYFPTLYLDGALAVSGAGVELARALEQLGPFGAGHPEPRFAIAAARIAYADVVGESHVRCTLAGGDGARLGAIAFRAVETPLGQALLRSDGRPLHAAGRLRVNTWRGRTQAQFMIDDAAPAW